MAWPQDPIVEYALLVRSADLYHALQGTKHWFNPDSNSWDGHTDPHFNDKDTEIYREAMTCPTSHINVLGRLLFNMQVDPGTRS